MDESADVQEDSPISNLPSGLKVAYTMPKQVANFPNIYIYKFFIQNASVARAKYFKMNSKKLASMETITLLLSIVFFIRFYHQMCRPTQKLILYDVECQGIWHSPLLLQHRFINHLHMGIVVLTFHLA